MLVDLFGYLSIVLHGVTIAAQSMACGGAFFLVLVARPYARERSSGAEVAVQTARLAGWSALALVLSEALTVALQAAVLMETVGLSLANVMSALFAVSALAKMVAAGTLAACLFARRRVAGAPLLALSLAILLAATATTHAAARLSGNALLLAASLLHLFGAALWLGGIPSFVLALSRSGDGTAYRFIGARFSRISMAGVLCIVLSAAVFSIVYVGAWPAVYGTAYGVMVSAKVVLFAALLLLGFGNFRVVERLRRNAATPVLRLRRFAEVEIGIGISLFFAAASLTSVPPAVDLVQDRVGASEIAARFAPHWPRLVSPDHDALALPALQAQLDREAAASQRPSAPAFVPGSGDLPARNAADIAWSEYNHHWAGLFVLALGGLALLHHAGVGWARHWPLTLLGLAVFVFLRADPEVWPLGDEGFFASLRDVEVLQHRLFVVLIVAFGIFEWGVRTGRLRRPGAALVFPLLCAIGGALLLTHSHAIANVREQLLIEWSHTPLALAGIAAGWARWLELRSDGAVRRVAGWVWPLCFIAIGALLLDYREA